MKIEDLKPGDRLWVDEKEEGKKDAVWNSATYWGDGMALSHDGSSYFYDLELYNWKMRTVPNTTWEKLVDLFFKRN